MAAVRDSIAVVPDLGDVLLVNVDVLLELSLKRRKGDKMVRNWPNTESERCLICVRPLELV